MGEENLLMAKKAMKESLECDHVNLYRTDGNAWRQILASIAFETKADLSLIQYFDEQE